MSNATQTPAAPETTEQTSTALARVDNRPVEIQRFEFQQRAAKLYAMSGLFADIKGQTPEQSIAQAFVKIQLGDSMGFNAAESMTGIDIIQGRVAVGSNLRGARMQRAGYSWDILQLDDKGCRLRLKKDGKVLTAEGDTPTIVSYMVEDATRAGLIGKDNYKKNPKNMFFSRAITNAQRWYAPGVLGIDILSTEEAQDLGPIIDGHSGSALSATNDALQRLKERYVKPEDENQEAGPTQEEETQDPQQVTASAPTPSPEMIAGQEKLERQRKSGTDTGTQGVQLEGKF